MKPIDRLAWIDLETTGLDPETDIILEVGLVITDAQFRVLLERAHTVKPTSGLPSLHSVVLNMHSKNGLLGALHSGSLLSEVDLACAGTVRGFDAAGGPICGSSPHFDKRFIDRHMPLLSACFNHRCFDASTLKMAECLRTGVGSKGGPPSHRAIDDIYESIRVAKACIFPADKTAGEEWANREIEALRGAKS